MQQKPKKPRTRIEDIRRVELIDAAHRIFLKEGLRGLTSTKICAEAGLSQGILTYYFRDKEEVLFEMVRMNNRILAGEIVGNLRRARSGRERLIALIDGNFPAQRFDKQAASAWISLYSEASHNERYARLLRPYYRRLRSNVSSILKPYLGQGEIDHFVRGFAAILAVFHRLVGLVVVDDGVGRDPAQKRGLVRREQRGRMHEAALLEVLDQGGARVLHLLARQDRRVLARALQCAARQARQEVITAHIRQEVVGADDIAGDARDNAAVGAVLAARQHLGKDRPCREAECVVIEDELALLIEQVHRMASDPAIAVIGPAAG